MTAFLDGRRAAPPEPAVTLDSATDPPPQAPYVSIILPCYNEQGHVTAEVERICAAMDASGYSYELIAYDDASTDETLARLYEPPPGFRTWRSCLSTATAGPVPSAASAPSGRGARSSCGPTPT